MGAQLTAPAEAFLATAADFLADEGDSAGLQPLSAAVGNLRAVLAGRGSVRELFAAGLQSGLLTFENAHLWANFVYNHPRIDDVCSGRGEFTLGWALEAINRNNAGESARLAGHWQRTSSKVPRL